MLRLYGNSNISVKKLINPHIPMFRYTFCIVLLAFICSCTNKLESSIKEFSFAGKQWNAIERIQHRGSIAYRASEVPLQYYLQKHLGVYDSEGIDSMCQNLNRERVLVMEFEQDRGVDLLLSDFTNRDYDAAVRYMAFDIQDDFKLVTTSKDTIPCSGVLFERNFKVAPFKRLLLHFGNINPDDKITLLYKDQLFGQGNIRFDFDDNPIQL